MARSDYNASRLIEAASAAGQLQTTLLQMSVAQQTLDVWTGTTIPDEIEDVVFEQVARAQRDLANLVLEAKAAERKLSYALPMDIK